MEAIRIGINFLDIRRVVIYIILYPNLHLSIPLQRSGQASRDGKKAKVIFLFKHWCFSKKNPLLQLKLKAIN